MKGNVDRGSGPPSDREIAGLIEREFLLAFKACEELEAASRERVSNWEGREQHSEDDPESVVDEIIVLEWARSTKTYGAAVALCRGGYGEQAAMLNRSLFEGMAVAHWTHAHADEAADRFKAALRYDAHLAAATADKADWRDEVDEEMVRNALLEGEELEQMTKMFGRYGERPWTGHRNLPELVKSIEDQWGDEARRFLWDFHDIAHRDNNQMLHSTVLGLRRSFARPNPEGGTVWVGPSNVHIGPALFGAHWSYSQTVTLAVERFELADRAGLDDMLELHMRYLLPMDLELYEDVGRNDPCPCESGKKYKACHEEQIEVRKSLARDKARSR